MEEDELRDSEAVKKVRETGGSGMIIGGILCLFLLQKLPILPDPPLQRKPPLQKSDTIAAAVLWLLMIENPVFFLGKKISFSNSEYSGSPSTR